MRIFKTLLLAGVSIAAAPAFADSVDDLISRMTLEEKAAQLQDSAPAIPRLGLPAYTYWNEALHGVARAGEGPAARVVEPGARVLPAGTRRAGEARRCGTRAVLVQRRQLPAPGTRERAGEEAQRLADQHRAGIRAESAISDVRADRTATVERNADKLAGAGCTAFTRRVALAEPRVSTRVSAV